MLYTQRLLRCLTSDTKQRCFSNTVTLASICFVHKLCKKVLLGLYGCVLWAVRKDSSYGCQSKPVRKARILLNWPPLKQS